MKNKTLFERFTEKYIVSNDNCWVWQATTKGKHKDYRDQYGQMNVDQVNVGAHRVAYMLFKGEIPEKYVIDHICRNTLCVNPDHLEAITARENICRGYDVKPKKTHCLRGHALTDDNVLTRIRNGRLGKQCKQCKNEARRKK